MNKRSAFTATWLTALLCIASCESLPGIIGGEKGDAEWELSVDPGIIDPIGIKFKGKRASETCEAVCDET